MVTQEQFKLLLPLACTWSQEQEQRILQEGVPLSSAQIADARQVGVAQPENVRLLRVASIPMPADPALRAAATETQLISPATAGLTLRYGIFIRSDCWNDRRLIAHELVHTRQYEWLGGFEQFLGKYLFECSSIGYPAAPMEQEAIVLSAPFQ